MDFVSPGLGLDLVSTPQSLGLGFGDLDYNTIPIPYKETQWC